jgi:hypothetical protein
MQYAAQAAGSNGRRQGFDLFEDFFLLKERQRITVNLFMILFLNAFSQLALHFFLVNLRAFGRFLPGW